MKGSIFNKAPDWNCWFCLRQKLKQNLGCPNKEYNTIFKDIHQNQGVDEQVCFVFLLPFRLANIVFSTYTDAKLLYKYEFLFFLKTGNLMINWIPYKHIVAKRLSSQSEKIWNQVDFKNLDFSTVKWIGKDSEVQSSILLKKAISIYFLNWENLRSPLRATLKNPKIFLWIGKNLEIHHKSNFDL